MNNSKIKSGLSILLSAMILSSSALSVSAADATTVNTSYSSFNSYGILYVPGTTSATLYNNAEVTDGTNNFGNYYEGGTFINGTLIQ